MKVFYVGILYNAEFGGMDPVIQEVSIGPNR